jgi:hypothetical protein
MRVGKVYTRKIYFIGTHLIGVHLIDVHLTGVHLTGVHVSHRRNLLVGGFRDFGFQKFLKSP